MSFNGMTVPSLPKVTISSEGKNFIKEIDENMELISKARRKEREATIETAANTAEMKDDLKTVIHNQNDYINLLKEQNDYIKVVLNNLFSSSEDAIIVQKEILKIMQDSNSSEGVLLDKGLDVMVPLVISAINTWLKSKGINL